MKNRLLALLLALTALLLSACGGEDDPSRTVYAMDTVMNLTVYGEGGETVLSEAESLLHELESTLSRRVEDSAVAALNRDGSVDHALVADLLAEAVRVAAATDGAFYPALAQVIDLWGFGTDALRVPSQEELSPLLEALEESAFSIAGDTVTLIGEADLDLGGIAKGCAGDLLCKLAREKGVESAVFDLGGDVAVLGTKPDGSAWRIAVKDPADAAQYLGVLTLTDAFVTTSGIYERYFEENGVRYHHILDPNTGKSAESGLVSVTVVCESGVWADALSTACFVLGANEARSLREDLADTLAFELILVTEDGRVLYTEGLADTFAPAEEGNYTYEVIS